MQHFDIVLQTLQTVTFCSTGQSAIRTFLSRHLHLAKTRWSLEAHSGLRAIIGARMDIYEELVRLRKLGHKCALATIVHARGSIPSYESAKLLVRDDGSMLGTIGGGCVEAEVWNAAREVLETEKPRRLSFTLGQEAAYDNGLICGGQLEIAPPSVQFNFRLA
jgi:hypothetical protein